MPFGKKNAAKMVAVLVAFGLAAVSALLHGESATPASNNPSAAEITRQAHVLVKLPPAIETYLKSPTHAKRQANYAKAWDNPKATLNYDDKSTQTLQLRKSPFDRVLSAKFKTRPVGKKTTKPDKDYAGWVTSTQEVKMTATSSSFLNNDYADSSANIYPGAIFAALDYVHGDYKPQKGARHPIDIATDNPNVDGSSFVTVKDPSPERIRDAVATLFHRMKGKAATDGFSSQVYESSNNSSWALQVSGGASFFGVSASNAFSTKNASSSVRLTVDVTLPLYSISATPPDQGYFTDPNVENNKDLVVVSNVVYGVRVLANMTITFDSSEAADDFHASLDWGVVTASAMTKYMSKHSNTVKSFNAYVIGGNAGNAAGMVTLDPKAFMQGIREILKGTTYQNARPISYQLRNMADDVLMTESLCDFTTVSSGPKDFNPRIAFIDCVFLSGQDGKDDDTNLNVYLYPPSYAANSRADDMVGAIYGYQSQSRSWRFGGGQEDQVPLTPGDGGAHFRPAMTRNDLIKQNGGRVRIHIYPNYNDTWFVTQANLILHFEDNSLESILLKSPGVGKADFCISQDVTVYDLVFTGKDITE